MSQSPDYRQVFLDYLKKRSLLKAPEGLYAPVDYIMQLGGKRLRPQLVLMACQAYAKAYHKALPAAMAVELFHNFSLVHDDIMDAAPLRRGKPTVHHKFGINAGILSGDVMLIYVYEFLRELNDPKMMTQLLSIFNKVAIEVCEGQQWDMEFETRSDVSLTEYLKMIEYKTAALISGGLQLGALIGGADEEDVHAIDQFGRNIGIAFQLQDDILDTFGDPEKFGKKVGGDIAQNKKTYLVIKALEVANTKQAGELNQWMTTEPADETQKINAVRQLFVDLGIQELAETEKQRYQQQAQNYFDQLSPSLEDKACLMNLAQELIRREV